MELSKKTQLIGGQISEILYKNDGFNDEGIAALLTVVFTIFKVITVPDEHGNKKERIREMLNGMLDLYFQDE